MNTWAASSVDCGSATRTPAVAHLLRAACGSASKNACSPPMPRSTRRPAAVSAPSAVSWPTSSRCSRWRACSGLITKPSSSDEHRHAEQHDEPERRPTTRAG